MGFVFKFLKKYWHFILGCLATAVVVTGFNDVILFPKSRMPLLEPTAFVRNEQGLVVVDSYHQRLVFANKNDEVVRVLKAGHRELPFDKICKVFSVDDHIYVSATTSRNKGIILSKEILAEYSPDGKYLGVRHQAEYSVEENLQRAGFQYVDKYDGGLLLTSLRGQEIRYEELNRQGANTTVSHKLDFIPWETYRIDEMRCHILGADGWYRLYDGIKKTITLQGRNSDIYQDYVDSLMALPICLNLCPVLLLKTYVFWGSVGVLAVLVLLMLVQFFMLLKKDAKIRASFFAITGAAILAIIITSFYGNYVYRGTMKHYRIMVDVECRIAYDILVRDHHELFRLMKTQDITDILQNHDNCKAIQDYTAKVRSIALNNGPDEAFSGALLIKDRDGRIRVVGDTILGYPDGTVYWDLDEQGKDYEDKPDVFVEFDMGRNDVFLSGFRKLYRDDGTCFGFLSLDISTKKIASEQRLLVLTSFLDLMMIMVVIYMLCFFANNLVKEMKVILQKRREGKSIIGAELSSTCQFMCGLATCTDDVLWVFAVIELCNNFGGDSTKMLGFMVVSTSVASFFAAALFPKLRSMFSSKTVMIIGILGRGIAYVLNLLAFIMHIPVLYAIGYTIGFGFSGGILKSVVTALPLLFTDTQERSKALSASYAARIIAVALTTLGFAEIHKIFGFIGIYSIALGLLLAVSPLLIFSYSCSNEDVSETGAFSYRTMLKLLSNSKGLGYLFGTCLPQVILYLFVANIFSTLLAKADVSSQIVIYTAIAGKVLVSIFPARFIAHRCGVKLANIILNSVMAFYLILTAGNNSVGWISIVYIACSMMYSQSWGSNIVLDLAEEEGYDKKVINDSNIFFVKLLSVPVAWFLGLLIVKDATMVCWSAGIMIFVATCIGQVTEWLGRRRNW